jgi:Gas vesicle synthesis protein GvpL/GvpF
VIDLYAVARHPTPALPRLAPLRLVAEGGLALIVTPARDDEVTPEALWRHEAVVEALMDDRDVLPVRFGTRLGGDAEARQVISERRDEFVRALARVEGAVELSVRCAVAPGDGDAPQPRAVHEPLERLARECRRRTPHGAAEILRAAYLVDRDAVDRFTACVAALQRRHPRLRLLCTGPWPAYTFAQP